MSKGDNNILSIYEEIFNHKKIIKEAASSISGIDELVYNPATKAGGTIGYGYDAGKMVRGITWAGHDNHLHIGFTNRDVAMKVIDKAQSMGLKCTENPYAKNDENNKVDPVHTTGSFHYKTFQGEPKVGAGVDITGDTNKITELIKWIENTYAGKNYSDSPAEETSTPTDATPNPEGASSDETYAQRTPALQKMMRDMAKAMYPQAPKGITEQAEFGKKPQLRSRGVKIVIPKENNKIIKAPYDGTIDNTKYFPDCKNRTTLKLSSGYHLTYCGLSKPVKNGTTILSGNKLGEAEEDITVSLYDENFSPVLYSDLKVTGLKKKKTSDDDNVKKAGIPKDEPIYSTIAQIPFRLFQDKYDKEGNRIEKRWGYATDKEPVDPWIVNAISKPFKKVGKFLGTNKSVTEEISPKERKLVENIEKIKKLIK